MYVAGQVFLLLVLPLLPSYHFFLLFILAQLYHFYVLSFLQISLPGTSYQYSTLLLQGTFFQIFAFRNLFQNFTIQETHIFVKKINAILYTP